VKLRHVFGEYGKPDRFYVDGRQVTEEEYRKVCPLGRCASGNALQSSKVKASIALAVHPKQVKEATEAAIRRGCPTDFLPDGRPIIRSRAHQAEFIKGLGLFNRDGGYGD